RCYEAATPGIPSGSTRWTQGLRQEPSTAGSRPERRGPLARPCKSPEPILRKGARSIVPAFAFSFEVGIYFLSRRRDEPPGPLIGPDFFHDIHVRGGSCRFDHLDDNADLARGDRQGFVQLERLPVQHGPRHYV